MEDYLIREIDKIGEMLALIASKLGLILSSGVPCLGKRLQ